LLDFMPLYIYIKKILILKIIEELKEGATNSKYLMFKTLITQSIYKI